jgi:metal-responsive CopG/Arc/MetJ family transcriptional regulator
MQSAFVKISVSLPDPIYSFLKSKSEAEHGVPVSRLIAQAVSRMAERETKSKKSQKRGARK